MIATRGPVSVLPHAALPLIASVVVYCIATRGPVSDCQRSGVLYCHTRPVLDYLSFHCHTLNCILSTVPVILLAHRTVVIEY